MKITPRINAAFESKARHGVRLIAIEDDARGTVFRVQLGELHIELPIYCKGKLTPTQAREEAPRVALYAVGCLERERSKRNTGATNVGA